LWLNKGKETGNRIPSGIPERKTHTLQKEGRNSPAGVYLFFKKENSSDFYNFPFSLSLFSTASLPWSKSYVQGPDLGIANLPKLRIKPSLELCHSYDLFLGLVLSFFCICCKSI